MKSENINESGKSTYGPQHQEHLKQAENIKNEANKKISSLRDENRKQRRKIMELKKEINRLVCMSISAYEELDMTNILSSELYDRVEKAIDVLEDKANVAGALSILKRETDKIEECISNES